MVLKIYPKTTVDKSVLNLSLIPNLRLIFKISFTVLKSKKISYVNILKKILHVYFF